MNNFYVYRHIRLDTDTPFYVGKGNRRRAWCKRRNKYWINIVNLVGYKIEIVESNLSEDQAFSKEIELIKYYKDLGQCEANMSIGGEGSSGVVRTQEWKDRVSKGVSKYLTGRSRPELKGRKHSPERCAAISAGQIGWKHSEESRAKMRVAAKGRTPWNKGLKQK